MRNLQKRKDLVLIVRGYDKNFHVFEIGKYNFNYEYEVVRFLKKYTVSDKKVVGWHWVLHDKKANDVFYKIDFSRQGII